MIMSNVTEVLENVNSLVCLCGGLTDLLGSSTKVRKDTTRTPEAIIGKLAALQDVLLRIQAAIKRNIHSGVIPPAGAEHDMLEILNGSRDALIQLREMMWKGTFEEGGLLAKMRKATVGAGVARDVEDIGRLLDIQKAALRLALDLITTQ
jgi:hypothetical protein